MVDNKAWTFVLQTKPQCGRQYCGLRQKLVELTRPLAKRPMHETQPQKHREKTINLLKSSPMFLGVVHAQTHTRTHTYT